MITSFITQRNEISLVKFHPDFACVREGERESAYALDLPSFPRIIRQANDLLVAVRSFEAVREYVARASDAANRCRRVGVLISSGSWSASIESLRESKSSGHETSSRHPRRLIIAVKR